MQQAVPPPCQAPDPEQGLCWQAVSVQALSADSAIPIEWFWLKHDLLEQFHQASDELVRLWQLAAAAGRDVLLRCFTCKPCQASRDENLPLHSSSLMFSTSGPWPTSATFVCICSPLPLVQHLSRGAGLPRLLADTGCQGATHCSCVSWSGLRPASSHWLHVNLPGKQDPCLSVGY